MKRTDITLCYDQGQLIWPLQLLSYLTLMSLKNGFKQLVPLLFYSVSLKLHSRYIIAVKRLHTQARSSPIAAPIHELLEGIRLQVAIHQSVHMYVHPSAPRF